MSREKFITVVGLITDADAAQPFRDLVCDSMGETKEIPGVRIVGISVYDEMSRVEYLERLLDENNIDYDQPAS
jgi:hypothetical protein